MNVISDVAHSYSTLVQCFFSWKVRTSSDAAMRGAQVILAQSFGLAGDGIPGGVSNEAMAKIVKEIHRQYELPMVLQWEIADCLIDLPMVGVVREHRKFGKYLDTREVLVQSFLVCKKQGWTRVIVVAHPDHIWRVKKVAEKLGLDVFIPDTSSVPYDPHSIQSWTRNKIRFIPREIAARLLYFIKDWL